MKTHPIIWEENIQSSEYVQKDAYVVDRRIGHVQKYNSASRYSAVLEIPARNVKGEDNKSDVAFFSKEDEAKQYIVDFWNEFIEEITVKRKKA